MSTLPFIISLWNARGLKDTTVHDVISHTSMSYVLFITESWYYSPMRLPIDDWPQFHVYGTKVKRGNNRGEAGICALVNPLCPYPVTQLPSLNNHTLSLKVGGLRIHCLYLPPHMPNDQVFDILESIPLLPNTFICGDLNARMGELLGDTAPNPRGTKLIPWCQDRQLTILNQVLSHSQPTYYGRVRIVDNKPVQVTSIIDLFITNITTHSLLNPSILIEHDLSLCSDHKLMTLSFKIDSSLVDNDNSVPSCMAPRRLWNLSRLSKPDTLQRYRSSFSDMVSPLQSQLSDLVTSPPVTCPPIDELNDTLNDCIYKSLDASVGGKVSRPKLWKKYWTQEIQDAAHLRDRCYRRWRRCSTTMDKITRWLEYKTALKSFRSLIQQAKRKSW
ncbi:hypothetical protein BD770DRAFT_320632, partial [Pilaira anomala]